MSRSRCHGNRLVRIDETSRRGYRDGCRGYVRYTGKWFDDSLSNNFRDLWRFLPCRNNINEYPSTLALFKGTKHIRSLDHVSIEVSVAKVCSVHEILNNSSQVVLLVLEGADWLVARGCFVDDPVGVASLKSCSKGLASSSS